MYTNNRGDYKFTVGKQSAGSKIEIRFKNSSGKYESTSKAVKIL